MANAGYQSAEDPGREQPEPSRARRAGAAPSVGGREDCSGNERRSTLLTRTIEDEIIPRLVLSARAAASVRQQANVAPDLSADVAEFSRLVLAHDEATAVAFAKRLNAAGLDVHTLFLELLTPAARRLGAMWEDDTLSFADVTIGLNRLHRVLHELSQHFEVASAAPEPRILLVPAIGEQHTFGVTMLAEFFRHAQWDASVERPATQAELCRLVRANWFAVIGFSVALTDSIDALGAAIRAVRKASQNRAIRVMVGGPAFLLQPERVATVGGDATAIDGRHAVVQAQGLLALLSRQG